MKLSEKPLVVQPLTRVRELAGGHKGVLFLLENNKPEKLVVKFQKEKPVEALAGTAMLQRVQASTPEVRRAIPLEVERIERAVRVATEPPSTPHPTIINLEHFRTRWTVGFSIQSPDRARLVQSSPLATTGVGQFGQFQDGRC
jgi:hypothetical protein